MKIVDRYSIIEIPSSIAICPICKAQVVIEDVDEWEEDDDGQWRISEAGLHVSCVAEPDIDNNAWEEFFASHFSTPYIDWLPIENRVWKWLDRNYRFDLHPERATTQ